MAEARPKSAQPISVVLASEELVSFLENGLTRTMKINGEDKPMLNNMTWTRIAVVSRLPATVAPVGFGDSGLPIGVQIIGAKFEDRTTIDFAKGLSELLGAFKAPPNYVD